MLHIGDKLLQNLDNNPNAHFCRPRPQFANRGPFVCPASSLFEDVYICNVLKCRPPGNRNPSPEEIAACMPVLKTQIDLIQPKVICALGRFALEGANHLLWPAVCDCCGCPVSADDKRLCRDCWNELLECTAGEYCPSCGKDVSKYGIINGRCAQCESLKLSFDGIARAGVYDGVLRDMILAFKFHDRTELGGILCELANSAYLGSAFRGEIDMIVPVPLHWRRRWRSCDAR